MVSRKELFFIWQQQQQQPACLPASSLPGSFLTLTRSRSRTAGATARQQLTLRQFFIELCLPVSSSGSIFTSVVAAAPFSEFALPPSALCSFHRGGIACYLLLLHTYIHYIHWIFHSHCSPVHGGLRPAGHHPSNPLHRSFLELGAIPRGRTAQPLWNGPTCLLTAANLAFCCRPVLPCCVSSISPVVNHQSSAIGSRSSHLTLPAHRQSRHPPWQDRQQREALFGPSSPTAPTRAAIAHL